MNIRFKNPLKLTLPLPPPKLKLMKRLALLIFILFTVLAFVGCASASYYEPAEKEEGYGYREQQLESQRYRVSFQGASYTPRETVEIYLLYRAAEIAAKNNYDYFTLTGQDTEAQVEQPSTGFFGSYGFGGRRSALGLGYHWAPGSHVGTYDKYEAVAYIKLLKEAPSQGSTQVYTTKEVLKNLEPRIKRPKK
jgi:hypothetical protein